MQWYNVSGAFKDETDKQEKSFQQATNKLQIYGFFKIMFSKHRLFVCTFFSFISTSFPYFLHLHWIFDPTQYLINCIASEVNLEGQHKDPFKKVAFKLLAKAYSVT